MAGKFTRLQKSYQIMDPDGVEMYTGVVLAGENQCKKPKEDNEIPLGVVDSDERVDDPIRAGGDQTGRQVAVKLEGIAEIRLAEPVQVGDRIILGAGGEAKSMPSEPGNYNVLGFAEKSGDKGDVIPIRMAYHVYGNSTTGV